MIKGLTYVLLVTPDLARARRFFTEQLGLTTEDDQGDTFSQFTTRDGTQWAILQASATDPAMRDKLYLKVDDVDGTFRTWQAGGVEMVSEPHDMPFGRTFAFKDADGRVLHVSSA